MPSASSVAMAALALTGLVASAPTAEEKTFKVHQVRNPRFERNGPMALAKAYLKYGVPLPSELAAAVANTTLGRRATGQVTASPEAYDSEYLCPVNIGTPAQTLILDFDTGSSDLWVFSTELSSSNGHTLYNPSSSSSSSKLSGYSWSITYGDGSSSSGNVYTDKVTIGGLTVSNQAVECASKVSSSFTSDTSLDGLVGLAFSSINQVSPVSQKTWFDNIKSQLSSTVFSVDLNYQSAGTYLFGGIDSSQYSGSMAYTSISSSQGFWMWSSTGYQVGSGSFHSTSIQGIADTGTTLLLLPSSIVNSYYGQISGSSYSYTYGGYVFPCSTTPPDFTFGVGSSTITIPGEFINYAPISSSTCYGGIQSDSGIGFAIFGDIALKSAYVVFDAGNSRLGWAQK